MSEERQPYPVAARALLRDSLLDAAREELQAKPWGNVTMAGVAKGAGVSRQTLYNEFGSRDELAQAFVMREGDRFLTAVEAAIADNAGDPAAALCAAFDVFTTAAADNPLVQAVLSGGSGPDFLPLVTTHGQPLLERTGERLSAAIRSGFPPVGQKDADLLAEAMVRLGISVATLPPGPGGLDGESLARVLGPYFDALLAGDNSRRAA